MRFAFLKGLAAACLLSVLFSLTSGTAASAQSSEARSSEARSSETRSAGPTAPQVRSHYAVLIDVATGKVLWARNPDVKRSIASTTKILTAILLLERGHPNDIVIAPNGVDKIEESSLHLTPGEKIPLHDLLYAMLLRSANDTAVAGATYLAGSVPAFAGLMNEKAREIGATNSHFVTPNGLYAAEHYSTAADLAKIARYAVTTLPAFNQIVKTKNYKVQRSMHIGDVWVKNTATTFLKDFPGADGIKTGYIHQAGHCFVGSATRPYAPHQNWRLIAVALDSNQCREDVMSLLNYGFANFKPTVVVSRNASVGTIAVPDGEGAAPVIAATDIAAVVSRFRPRPMFQVQVIPLPILPSAPVAAGTKLGTIAVLVAGKVQATGDAIAAQAVSAQMGLAILHGHGPQQARRPPGVTLANWIGGLMLGALALMIGKNCYARTTAKSARRRRNWLTPDLRGVDTPGPRPR